MEAESSKTGRKQDGTFKKGFTGNPNGRPKKEITIPHLLREYGNGEINDPKTGKTKKRIQLAIEKVWEMALSGDRWAIDYISNRTEGTPVQTIRNQEIDEAEIVIQ